MEEIISALHNFFQKIIGRELPNLVSEINIALISKKRHYKKQSKTKNYRPISTIKETPKCSTKYLTVKMGYI